MLWVIIGTVGVLLCASAGLLAEQGRRSESPLVGPRGAGYGAAPDLSGSSAASAAVVRELPDRRWVRATRIASDWEAA